MCVMPADLEGSAASRPLHRAVAEPEDGFVRMRMTIAYDGAKFHGMAENANVRTVIGDIRAALEPVVGHALQFSMAGRTDAGVHAWGQVISFDVKKDCVETGRGTPEYLARAINRQCVPEIVVREADFASQHFDARFSARSRRYRYTVLHRSVPDPFLAATTWWVPEPIDIRALRLGCDALYGSHDFSSFCRRPKTDGEVSLIRRVVDATWVEAGDDLLRFEIEASSFCHQMVRSIVGTLVEMGRGRRRPGEMAAILRARDRSLVPRLAPPQGLCLWEVTYDED